MTEIKVIYNSLITPLIPYHQYLSTIDDISFTYELYTFNNIASIFVTDMISGYVIKLDGTQYKFESIEGLKLNEAYYNSDIKQRVLSLLCLLHLNTCNMAKSYSKYVNKFHIPYRKLIF